jgi:hypothetical protein
MIRASISRGHLRLRAIAVLAAAASLATADCHNPSEPSGPPAQLTANVVDPAAVNAVSKFNSCSGHAFPDGSPNSAKNYFWPNSSNFSTNGVLTEYAACDGTTGQNSDDTSANETDRGVTIHLFCDGSSTQVRYFHIIYLPAVFNARVKAGDVLGAASMVGTGQAASVTWQNSSNFDIAVSDGGDNATEDYFAKLNSTAFAAWAARGLSSVAQTINPGNPTCPNFLSAPGSPDIFSFTPPL